MTTTDQPRKATKSIGTLVYRRFVKTAQPTVEETEVAP